MLLHFLQRFSCSQHVKNPVVKHLVEHRRQKVMYRLMTMKRSILIRPRMVQRVSLILIGLSEMDLTLL